MDKALIKKYFLLGEQYGETAKLLLETLIKNGNSNMGIGSTMEEAKEMMERNSIKSDLYLFIPAIFSCLQCTELYMKGLILLSGNEFTRGHSAENLLDKLKEIYKEDSEVFSNYKAFYESQIDIIREYKRENGIVRTDDLYMSLRYPEITLHLSDGKKVNSSEIGYEKLMYNGDVGIRQFSELLCIFKAVKQVTVKEYNQKAPLF